MRNPDRAAVAPADIDRTRRDDRAHVALVADFRLFHAEVLRVRAELETASSRLAPPFAALPPDSDRDTFRYLYADLAPEGTETEFERAPHAALTPPPPDAEIVAARLAAMLERLLGPPGQSEAAAALRREACYAMAALADDIFLHDVDWPGRDAWRGLLLEYRLFRSHAAGEEVFARIERLLRTRGRGPVALAQLYLLVLQQGFRGGLRAGGAADDAAAALEHHAARLFEFIHRRPPGLDAPGRMAFPQALAHTLTGPRIEPSRPGGAGVWAAAAAVAALLLAGQAGWLAAVSGIAEAASAVWTAGGQP